MCAYVFACYVCASLWVSYLWPVIPKRATQALAIALDVVATIALHALRAVHSVCRPSWGTIGAGTDGRTVAKTDVTYLALYGVHGLCKVLHPQEHILYDF